MTTWDEVHAGCVILGHDNVVYGVASWEAAPGGPIIELVRDGLPAGRAQPPTGTPITVLEWPDLRPEAQAFAVLSAAGFNVDIIRESYRP